MTHEHNQILEDRTLLCIGSKGGCSEETMTVSSHWTAEGNDRLCVRCGAELRWTVKAK